MKYRSDFVTNSSSSSFIISKSDEINNTEKLFQFMKTLYFKYINAKNQMIEFCKSTPDFIVTTEEDSIHIKTVYGYKTEEARQKNHQLCDILNKKFGIDYWENLNHYDGWLSYETYEDYIKNTKDEKYISFYKKPFIILDFNNVSEENKQDVKDVLGWYFPCYCDEEDCEWCDHKDTDKCIKNKTNKTASEFGSVCIYSESGYIPDFVRKELEKHCELHCNHMG